MMTWRMVDAIMASQRVSSFPVHAVMMLSA
jgi:hypothetical protein